VIQEAINIAFQKKPRLTVSQWADKHRILSKQASAEPGKWRTDRVPYLREIMDSLSSFTFVREVTVMKGAQVGFSEAGLNWVGYVIDHAPGPMMMVQPTDMMAKRFSNQRLKGLIADSDTVIEKVVSTKSRDSGNTMLLKEFDGGVLVLVGANSASGLSSMPVQYLILDEPDRYPIDLPGEGDPIKLAEARTRTFSRRKIFRISTPTVEGQSQIHLSYQEGDQRKYMVPCPFCSHKQEITWERIKWANRDPATAHMECVECKKEIGEHHKTDMLKGGEWVPTNPLKDSRVRSYHLSSLYSPAGWYSWKDAVKEFLEVKDNPVRLRVFVNTVLGHPWKQKGDAPEWRKLFDRRETYEFNKIPRQAPLVTAGADVQRDRIEVEIVAWGKNFESWSIDYRTYYGDTSNPDVYKNLDALLVETFPIVGSTLDKEFLRVQALAIDTGFNTQTVYNWCRGKGSRVIPIKGIDNNVTLVARPNYVDVTVEGRVQRRGLALWTVGTNIAKNETYAWLRAEKPKEGEAYPPGYCHFPQYDEGYFKMLTAEQMTKKIVRGYPRYVWEKIYERNEALDCRQYARAAAYIIGMDRYTDKNWSDLIPEVEKVSETPEKRSKVAVKRGIKFKKSEFWG
jgi:phage terminase large subunit GpA-like protein